MADKVIRRYAYAKINLFLHVLDKRVDGYHNLQTWFQFIDIKDELMFDFNSSNKISIKSNIDISSLEDNLIYKAIVEFEKAYNIKIGVDVFLDKKIPMGAGLGGGSSDAACALLMMRDKYMPDIKNSELMSIAAKLGADVPIFILGKSAYAEGIGDILTHRDYQEQFILIVKPDVHISTADFFNSPYLEKVVYLDLNDNENRFFNSFENVFATNYPDIYQHIKSVDNSFKMTGTGSCFYVLSENLEYLHKISSKLSIKLDKHITKTLNYTH